MNVMDAKYRSEEQFEAFERLCDSTYRLYYELYENYPEVEVYINETTDCEVLVNHCEIALSQAGFTGDKEVQVSTRSNEYNELLFTLDLREMGTEDMSRFFTVLKETLNGFATDELTERVASSQILQGMTTHSFIELGVTNEFQSK